MIRRVLDLRRHEQRAIGRLQRVARHDDQAGLVQLVAARFDPRRAVGPFAARRRVVGHLPRRAAERRRHLPELVASNMRVGRIDEHPLALDEHRRARAPELFSFAHHVRRRARGLDACVGLRAPLHDRHRPRGGARHDRDLPVERLRLAARCR